MGTAEQERLHHIISAAASGAGSGAAALRRAGVEIDLEDFALEVNVGPEQAISATVRIAFVPIHGNGSSAAGEM